MSIAKLISFPQSLPIGYCERAKYSLVDKRQKSVEYDDHKSSVRNNVILTRRTERLIHGVSGGLCYSQQDLNSWAIQCSNEWPDWRSEEITQKMNYAIFELQ